MRNTLVFLLLSIASAAYAADCAATPQEAARSLFDASFRVSADSKSGYRTTGVVYDAVLQRLWFRIVDCADLQRSATLLPIGFSPEVLNGIPAQQPAASRTVAVRAGERINLLYQQGKMQIHMEGISETNGAIGDRVIVRSIPAASTQVGSEVRFAASITGPGEAVLLP